MLIPTCEQENPKICLPNGNGHIVELGKEKWPIHLGLYRGGAYQRRWGRHGRRRRGTIRPRPPAPATAAAAAAATTTTVAVATPPSCAEAPRSAAATSCGAAWGRQEGRLIRRVELRGMPLRRRWWGQRGRHLPRLALGLLAARGGVWRRWRRGFGIHHGEQRKRAKGVRVGTVSSLGLFHLTVVLLKSTAFSLVNFIFKQLKNILFWVSVTLLNYYCYRFLGYIW
jgi:hypothetical protein